MNDSLKDSLNDSLNGSLNSDDILIENYLIITEDMNIKIDFSIRKNLKNLLKKN